MASGDSLLQWVALSNQTPLTAYATLDFRNSIPVLDFDDATTEAAIFGGVLPRHYSGAGITVQLSWMASSATGNNVVWDSAFERGNTDLDTDSFATAVQATGTANATSGIITNTSIAHTNGAQLDSLAVGDPFRLRVQRLGANGSDTMSGDAELIVVEIRET